MPIQTQIDVNMRKLILSIVLIITVSLPTFAGGLLTNTNQHILFLRNIARGASTEIDAAYSNPAGLAYLSRNGFHLSLNGQSAFQTRTIHSTFKPFVGFGGEETKVFKGEASAPFVPSLFAAYKTDKWVFSGHFAIGGGGGKATFNQGLASFESQVAMIPLMLGDFPGTDQYSVNSYMRGSQMIYGLQLGATYKATEHFSAYVGVRVNYVTNNYTGYLRDIKANIKGGPMVNVSDFLTQLSSTLLAQSEAAAQAGDPKKAEELLKQSQTTSTKAQLAGDKELDVDQTGWGATPIFGVHFNYGKWNVGVKYEMNTKLNIENKTKINTTGVADYDQGINTPHDIPSLLSIGASYQVLPTLKASVGYHHYFDKNAKMANGKQKFIKNGTNEYLGGLEWDVVDWAQLSAGIQRTRYGVGDNYQSDISFAISSFSYGLGAGFKITPNLKLNIAYFWTDYSDYNKMSDSYNGIKLPDGTGVPGSDRFTRTNKVFGIGADYTF